MFPAEKLDKKRTCNLLKPEAFLLTKTGGGVEFNVTLVWR